MLETYSIGVRLELSGNVSTGLDAIIRQLDVFDKGIKVAQTSITQLETALRSLGSAGAGLSGITRAMRAVSKATLNPALLTDLKLAEAATNGLAASMNQTAAAAASAASAMGQAARATNQANRQSTAAHGSGKFSAHDFMTIGMGASMVGEPLTHLYTSSVERDASVEHLRQVMLQDNRVTPAMADQAVSAAYAATNTAPGSRVSGNLASILDLKNLTGSLDEAMAIMPAFAKLSTALEIIDRQKGGTGDPAFAAGKALDILGGMITETTDAQGHTVRELNPAALEERLAKITRAAVATQGRVDPSNYLAFAKTARAAGMLLSDEFLYEKLPAISMVVGGSRAGTALMSMLQVFQGGKMTGASYDALAAIGLADPRGHREEVDPRTGKTREIVDNKGIFDLNLLGKDPELWMEAAQKRMEAAGIHGTEAQITALMKASQRSTIAGIFADLLKDMPAILREQENIRHTSLNSADRFAANDPTAKMMQLEASWDKFLTALGSAAMPQAIAMLDAATGGLNALSNWAKDNPKMATMLVDTAGGLGAVATALGVLSAAIFFFSPALKLLGITSAVGAAGVAGTAAGVGLGVAGAGATVGGLIYGADPEKTKNAQKALEELAKQRRTDPMATPNDGFDASGNPIPLKQSYLTGAGGPPIMNVIYIDGQRIAEVLTTHQEKAASRPSIGPSLYDPSVTQPWPHHDWTA